MVSRFKEHRLITLYLRLWLVKLAKIPTKTPRTRGPAMTDRLVDFTPTLY